MAGLRARKSLREVVVESFGAGRVEAEWEIDSRMPARVRPLVQRPRAGTGLRRPAQTPGDRVRQMRRSRPMLRPRTTFQLPLLRSLQTCASSVS